MLPSLTRRTLLPLLAFTSFTRSLSNRATSMSFTTERSGGTITVSPRNEADQSGLIVISHGLGDTAEGFADVAEVGHSIQIHICIDTSLPVSPPNHSANPIVLFNRC